MAQLPVAFTIWQAQIDPALVKRLLRPIERPGVVAPNLARRMWARMHGIGTPLTLLERARRYQLADSAPDQLAIVFPRAAEPAASTSDPAAAPAIDQGRPIVQQIISRVIEHVPLVGPAVEHTPAVGEARPVVHGRIARAGNGVELIGDLNVLPLPIAAPSHADSPVSPTQTIPRALPAAATVSAAPPSQPAPGEPNLVLPPARRVRRVAEEPYTSDIIEHVLPARRRESPPDPPVELRTITHPYAKTVVEAGGHAAAPPPMIEQTQSRQHAAAPTEASARAVAARSLAPLRPTMQYDQAPPQQHAQPAPAMPRANSVLPLVHRPAQPESKAPAQVVAARSHAPTRQEHVPPQRAQPAPAKSPAHTLTPLVHLPVRPEAVTLEHSPAGAAGLTPAAEFALGGPEHAARSLADAPRAALAVPPTPASAAPSAARPIDFDRIAEKVLRKLMRELDVEGERKGWRR